MTAIRTTRTITKQAATGSLIGLALGDALGFPTEFNDVPPILAKCGPWREMDLPRPAIVTDDTQMTLALARGIRTAMDRGLLVAAAAGAAGARGVRRLVPLPGEQPRPRPHLPGRLPAARQRPALAGGQPDRLQGLRRQHAGRARRARTGAERGTARGRRAVAGRAHPRPPDRARRLRPHGPRRVPARAGRRADGAGRPAALVRVREPQPLLRALARQPVDLLATTRRPRPSSPAAGTSACRSWNGSRTALRTVDPETDPCLATGDGWIAEEALATALLCFLLFPEEPVTALRRAACTTGDSDSIACLAGAFAGAHLGAGAWPKEWAERIEYRSDLMSLGALWDS